MSASSSDSEDLSPELDLSATRIACIAVFTDNSPVVSFSPQLNRLWDGLAADTGFHIDSLTNAVKRVNALITAIDRSK